MQYSSFAAVSRLNMGELWPIGGKNAKTPGREESYPARPGVYQLK